MGGDLHGKADAGAPGPAASPAEDHPGESVGIGPHLASCGDNYRYGSQPADCDGGLLAHGWRTTAHAERVARRIDEVYARRKLHRRVHRLRAGVDQWITARPQPADYLLRAVVTAAGCVTLAVLIWLSD